MGLMQLLGKEELERVVGKLSALASSLLFVLDEEGKILVEAGRDEFGCPLGGSFSVHEGSVRCPEESCPRSGELVSIPIEVYGQNLGSVAGCGEGAAARAVELLADVISQRAKDEFELESLSAEIVDKYEEITLLYEVSSTLGTTFEIEQIARQTLEYALRVIEAQKAAFLLLDAKGEMLEVVAAEGVPEEAWTALRVGEGISGQVVAERKPQLIEAGQPLPPDWERERTSYGADSFLSVPLLYSTPGAEEKVLGVINLADKASGIFTSGDLKLLTAIASQAAISIYKSQLVEELKEAERVKREMEIAHRIQMSLLPERPPEVEGVELAGMCIPAMEVGGDYYDFLHRDGRLDLIIADVSGHSVGSALMMAITRTVLRSEIAGGKSPAQVLAATNATMYDDLSRAELFITVFHTSYDKETRTLTYANGGHNPPFLWRAAEGKCISLDADGMLLGILEDVDYEERIIELQPGDILVLYTDGVTEARNEAGEFFGEERLRRAIEEGSGLSPAELLDDLYRRIYEHSKGVPQRDDITLVVMKVK